MLKSLTLIAAMLVTVARLSAGQATSLDELAPSFKQLGPGWTSNYIVFCVDQLHPTNEICNESKRWLELAHRVVGKEGCEAYAIMRYYAGTNHVLVWMYRYQSKEHLPKWGTNMQATAELGKLGKLPQVGDKVDFYQRNGVHNNIVFQRDTYSVDVEGLIYEFERLKKVAEAFDRNLLRAQKPDGR
ncbi:MAG TPA: hypothetical protein VNT26_11685 [Candidatus Sulfotelmatobacter sp.]|nr:hypothetical protein [Candidatus Sulfotelmatobacter sp.]